MVTLLAATLLLSGAAIYNGYPLVWPDTSSYIGLVNHSFRSFFYNLFVSPALLSGSLWTVIFFQSLIVAHLLRLVLRTVFTTESPLIFLGLTALLSLLSSLPWVTGFLMPDIFTPVLILSVFLLIFCLPRLGPGERKYLFALTTVSATVHFSHFPLAAGLLLAASIFRLAIRIMKKGLTLYLSGPSLAVIMAGGLLLANSYFAYGVVALSPAWYAFPLARLLADGPAVQYLHDHCLDRKYALCDYIDDLSAGSSDDFLWPADSPFRKVGWFDGYRSQGQEIVMGTISQYPLWTLKTSLRNTVQQLFDCGTGGGLVSYLKGEYPTVGIRDSFPRDRHAYESSKQNLNRLGLDRINRLHMAFLALSLLIAAAAFLFFLDLRQWLPVYLLITIVLAYLLNALITGAVSGPSSRYASRLIWLFPFFSLTAVLHTLRRGKDQQGGLRKQTRPRQ